jgi:ubiquinone/menaquinone biosynthesis C-methylase UbiE
MYRLLFLLSTVSFFIITSCKEKSYDTSLPMVVPAENDSLILDNIENHTNVGRAIWQKPGIVIEKLGNISDKVIADIGAGTGYFAFRLAPRAEKVIAIEIEQELLDYIDSLKIKLPTDKQGQLETRLATPDNPMLKDEEADIILIINTIAYIKNLPAYLEILQKGLKKNGRIIIIDYKMKKLPINAPPRDERIYLDVLEDMLIKSGFTLVQSDDTSLEYQYIIIAQNN